MHPTNETINIVDSTKDFEFGSHNHKVENLQSLNETFDIVPYEDDYKFCKLTVKLNLCETQSDDIINHTALVSAQAPGKEEVHDVKIYFDSGSDYSVIMKNSVERIGLKTEDGDTELSFKSMTGQSEYTKLKTKITLKPFGTSDINLELFVIDADGAVRNPIENIKRLWPNLDRELRKEVEKYIVHGYIDILIGLDLLYSFTDGTAIPHP